VLISLIKLKTAIALLRFLFVGNKKQTLENISYYNGWKCHNFTDRVDETITLLLTNIEELKVAYCVNIYPLLLDLW